MKYVSLFFSDAALTWLGAPVWMRWFARVIIMGAIALLLYHLFAGSL